MVAVLEEGCEFAERGVTKIEQVQTRGEAGGPNFGHCVRK